MNLANAIIRTKINLPVPRPELVARPQLRDRVNQGLAGPLTLVVAPAGFGKTTLIASCVADRGKQIAWLSLDKQDDQPGRFLTYLIAALHAAEPRIAADTFQLQSDLQSTPPEIILTGIINDLDRIGEEIVLVLDDFQLITSQAVTENVVFLLDHCPQSFHLVICARSDPALPIARLRSRGQLIELRSADLRFTLQEAAKFLIEIMGLGLDETSVALLEERTEGWIAGLQLAAISMHDRKDLHVFIENFSGTNRYILDYLLEEVLSSQPPEIQHFLMHTAILERISAPLCDAILGIEKGSVVEGDGAPALASLSLPRDSASALEYLERANLFLIPLDDERRWFRYHHLFVDLLRSRLANTHLGQNQSSLHRRASAWFERNGLAEEAISHSMAAQDYPTAAGQIETAAENAWLNGRYAEIITWTKALPMEIVQNHPWLCVWNAWAHTQIGVTREIHHWLKAAEAAAASAKDDGPAIVNAIAVLKVFETCFLQEYDRAIAMAESVLAVPSSRSPDAYDFIRCNLLHLLSSMYYATGQLTKAEQICRETITLADDIGFLLRRIHASNKLILIETVNGHLTSAYRFIEETQEFLRQRGRDHYIAAFQLSFRKLDLLIEWNRLDEAQRLLEEVQRQLKLFEVPYLLVDFYNIQAYTCLIQHNSATAQDRLNQAAALARQTYIWEGLTWRTASLQARLWLDTGNPALLRAWLDEQPEASSDSKSFADEARILARARLDLAEGAGHEVILLMERLSEAAERDGRYGSLIQMKILSAIAWNMEGEKMKAAAELEPALALAEAEGYARAFLDEGQPAQMLLSQWRNQAAAGLLRAYATHLLSQWETSLQSSPTSQETTAPNGSLIEPEAQAANNTLLEPLSPRELEVLNLMAMGHTNQQIADRLVVARGTIKAQAVSIFRKLDVSNRTEAVARARQLGILS